MWCGQSCRHPLSGGFFASLCQSRATVRGSEPRIHAAGRGPLHVDDGLVHQIDGAPAHYNSPRILVGGDETCEPRCDEHFVLPGRPFSGGDEASPQRRIWPAAE